MKIKNAFTLAEVLITLAVVGVVASMAIPGLVNNAQKTEYLTGLKKAYATLSEALNMYRAEHGAIEYMFECNNQGPKCILDRIAPYLSLAKTCNGIKGCWYDSDVRWLNGNTAYATYDTTWQNANGKATLADGMMIKFSMWSESCTHGAAYTGPLNNTICADFEIDVNGAKGPNMIGRDFFSFWITKNGIKPKGEFDDKDCEAKNDFGCAAKVLKENAMNY